MNWQYQIVYDNGVREIISQRVIPGETYNRSMNKWHAEVEEFNGPVPYDANLKSVNEHDSDFVQNFVTPC